MVNARKLFEVFYHSPSPTPAPPHTEMWHVFDQIIRKFTSQFPLAKGLIEPTPVKRKDKLELSSAKLSRLSLVEAELGKYSQGLGCNI